MSNTTGTTTNVQVPSKRAPARTPEQKAQDAVDAAQKRNNRAKGTAMRAAKAVTDATLALELAKGELSASKAALDYAKANPDLQSKSGSSSITVDGPGTTPGVTS